MRLIYYASLLLGIILFTFILFHVMPADPARIILGPNADERQVEMLRKELGLDKPLHSQFEGFLSKTIRFDFGRSYIDGRMVYQEVLNKFKISIFLVTITVIFILIYSIVIVLGSARLSPFIDSLNFLFISTPTFFSGVIVAIVVFLFYPFTSFSGDILSIADILYLLPPAFVLALYPMAILARILRHEMERINKCIFITSARALGFSEMQIRLRHSLKNALVPFMAALSNQLPMLFTGAFIVEIIFSIPGIGSLLIKSILHKDFPMLEAVVILNALLFISINLVFEFLYPVIDPRIRGSNA